MRYHTTPPSVQEARSSVFWSIFFISILYMTASPAYAVLAKFRSFTQLGRKFRSRNCLAGGRVGWVGLMSIEDINHDGILQLAELSSI